MSNTTNDGGFAFPGTWWDHNGTEVMPRDTWGGITKREHFAALAMQGLLANPGHDVHPAIDIAHDAYLHADAMLRAGQSRHEEDDASALREENAALAKQLAEAEQRAADAERDVEALELHAALLLTENPAECIAEGSGATVLDAWRDGTRALLRERAAKRGEAGA